MKQIVIFIILSFPTISFACSCVASQTIEAELKHCDLVITGQVISQSLIDNLDSLKVISSDTSEFDRNNQLKQYVLVKIKVITHFKGTLTSDTVLILTPESSASCGYYFKVGQQYIVYATTYEYMSECGRKSLLNNLYWTTLCTRTTNFNIKEEEGLIKLTK